MTTTTHHSNIRTLLDEACGLKHIDHAKLAELSGISERYIVAIQNIDTKKLPAAPYIRGYLKKISEVLDLDYAEVLELYKKELEQKTSGKHDTLPINRFAIKRFSKKIFIYIGLCVLVGMYLIMNSNRLLGKPNLVIAYPSTELTAVSTSTIMLTGNLHRQDKLTINGEELFIDADNTFESEYTLQPGLNTIEFKAKRLLGKEITVLRQIMFEAPVNIIK
ncbi:MAG: helix-turn-helix domain-containing protein [bacterium]|nr:helix-turn-helix domain-containing protein [bacterium]